MEYRLTKTGLKASWEEGGATKNRGTSLIVTNKDGSKKKPIFKKKGGHLANGQHALFVVHEGDILIKAFQCRGDAEVKLFKITGFEQTSEEFGKVHGEEIPYHEQFAEAVAAAKKKACCYHCRCTHYGESTL